jgi:hypothetical protein
LAVFSWCEKWRWWATRFRTRCCRAWRWGFLWNLSKDPLAIFIGAMIAGLVGTALVSAITRTTRLKEDAALGLVLASFFAAGICLVTMIQQLPTGNKSGIDKFLFGQAAALGPDDIALMGTVTGIALVLVTLFTRNCSRPVLIRDSRGRAGCLRAGFTTD